LPVFTVAGLCHGKALSFLAVAPMSLACAD